jgi:hypothetical protein
MKISTTTADLIDAIANRGLPVLWWGATTTPCVSTFIPVGSNMDDLPRAGAQIRLAWNGDGYTVHWPEDVWDEHVTEYVSTIADASGVANATPPGVIGD